MADWVDGFHEECERDRPREELKRNVTRDIQFEEDRKFMETMVRAAFDVAEDDLHG